jgi:hypothetical protein
MDLTEGSETSAKHNLTPGKYPKEHIQDSEHGENLKSRITPTCFGKWFPGINRQQCKVDLTPSSAEITERVELYLYSRSVHSWHVTE